MIRKKLEELKNVFGKSASEPLAKAEEQKEQEEQLAENVVQETVENVPEADSGVEVVEVNVSKSLEAVFKPYVEAVSGAIEEFRKAFDALREENKNALSGITEVLSAIAETNENLKKAVEELEKRVSKLEETPNVRKSVRSDLEVKERFEKHVEDYRGILNKLTDLAIQGKINPIEVSKFELTKSLDALSPATRRLLN